MINKKFFILYHAKRKNGSFCFKHRELLCSVVNNNFFFENWTFNTGIFLNRMLAYGIYFIIMCEHNIIVNDVIMLRHKKTFCIFGILRLMKHTCPIATLVSISTISFTEWHSDIDIYKMQLCRYWRYHKQHECIAFYFDGHL